MRTICVPSAGGLSCRSHSSSGRECPVHIVEIRRRVVAGDCRVVDGRSADGENTAADAKASRVNSPVGPHNEVTHCSARAAAESDCGVACDSRCTGCTAYGQVSSDDVGRLGLFRTLLGPQPGVYREIAGRLVDDPAAQASARETAIAAIATGDAASVTAGGAIAPVAPDNISTVAAVAAVAALGLIRREIYGDAVERGGAGVA